MRGLIAMGALALLLSGCGRAFDGPPPSQQQQLCQSWGYAPNDPVCRNTFRRDPP